jgi:hypothetical protein
LAAERRTLFNSLIFSRMVLPVPNLARGCHMLSITSSIPAHPNRIRYVCGDCIRALSRRWEERQPGAAN